ncbi:undecaprenyldiphospho-muramoylpentapeptide beta-N-acetylglucosaminyltransferase [Paenibacillus segetis]|uniref:UDP-N-acetylglucosamine--N-acetylmuramyl-(pentapeptide) pyrophosphoryl-undecaprenol N-acetylglucosamine transferase n=1 Tax=Paenibacillus segetis TaxID=1325360 RepID=A0ABQ1YI42_9BACL|nr:undecaprenyldiphospho-muramoylpentapeptide beta-N-acetylglucosaminyltransferase [Paenibacillus segetis]GGH27092.1 UDP-N-acetylglucosamine--N-acetylmuramyl-(pentapeptide) pyrophosphoryl-undecaprenol N-acetylglucosamine transferase [Paenibacillus segetis]
MSKRILFTGGGSAGHVSVNMALIPRFIDMGWDVKYMGSKQGIEAELINKLGNVEYISISTGKLRRYFDWENIKDPVRVTKGIIQAYQYIREMKPDVVFSKGGFVSVPVIIGARLNRVPIIIHESDITPGLANKISMPFASKICVTFPETAEHAKDNKTVHVGAVIREELMRGSVIRGLTLCDFTRSKPVIVVMGGSLGSQRMNEILRRNLHHITTKFQVVHICGKGQMDPSYHYREYKQFEYIHDELADILAIADLVISRAGSNSIFEFLALKKPMLLIPLSKEASRGDQILNAQSFKSAGYCEVLLEEEMHDDTFLMAINDVFEQRPDMMERMSKSGSNDAINKVVELIKSISK